MSTTAWFFTGVAATIAFEVLTVFGFACAAMSKRPSAVQIAHKQMRADAKRLKKVAG